MKAKVFLILFLAIGLTVVFLRGFRSRPQVTMETETSVPEAASLVSEATATITEIPATAKVDPDVMPLSGGAGNEATAGIVESSNSEAAVEEKINQLNFLATQDDGFSHRAILMDLEHSEKKVRAAALEAIVQIDDLSVIPRLKEIADTMADAEGKAGILDAVELMNLPSFTERLDAGAKKKTTNTAVVETGTMRRYRARMDARLRGEAENAVGQSLKTGQ